MRICIALLAVIALGAMWYVTSPSNVSTVPEVLSVNKTLKISVDDSLSQKIEPNQPVAVTLRVSGSFNLNPTK